MKIGKGNKMKKILSLILVAACSLTAYVCAACTPEPAPPVRNENFNSHEKIYLYSEGNVPYDSKTTCREYVFLTPYLAEYPTGSAVLVFAGGAYKHLSNSSKDANGNSQGIDNEGEQREASDIAEWYNAKGISVFVVNYRTENVAPDISYLQLLSDGTRAVRYVRKNAQSYNVDTDKIAVQGYSAGGHLASMLCTQGEKEWVIADENYVPDEVDGVSSRPNAGVLGYAVSSFQQDITHTSTRKRFCTGIASDKLNDFYKEYSAELRVSDKTCPIFLWHEKGDKTVPYLASQTLFNALLAADIKTEFYLYNDKGENLHGIGCAQSFEQASEWPVLATGFLTEVFKK